VHKEAGAAKGAVGGQPGWEQRVMEAAVSAADADARDGASTADVS